MRRCLHVVLLLTFGGCFNPHIESGGFVCDPTQTPACPSGFICVNDRCVNETSAGGSGGGGGSTSPNDMASHSPSLDLSAADLSMGSTCAHSLCMSGAKLSSSCDPCVAQICAQDSYCCVTKWSSQCVAEVTSICNQTCP